MYASGIGNEPIAQRMISHVWEEFRAANSDVEALGLRAIFFGEMMNNSEYYEYQNGRTAVQNRNSALNHYQVDALELGQSEDFLLDVPKSAITSNLDFKEMAKYVSAQRIVSRNFSVIPLQSESILNSGSSVSHNISEQLTLPLCELNRLQSERGLANGNQILRFAPRQEDQIVPMSSVFPKKYRSNKSENGFGY